MGYTHYHTQLKEVSLEQWTLITRDFNKLLEIFPFQLAFEYDQPDQPVQVNGDTIRFNGKGSLGHETMLLERNNVEFHFCKTNEKPYDLAVCALLILANTHSKDCWDIGSDGESTDWEPAMSFISRTLCPGYSLPERV